MRTSFKNIEYFLIVGIGGGVPRMGIRVHGRRWCLRDYTEGPPRGLLATVNLLRGAYHSIGRCTSLLDLLLGMRAKIDTRERARFEN